jgi:hypothetical protein
MKQIYGIDLSKEKFDVNFLQRFKKMLFYVLSIQAFMEIC